MYCMACLIRSLACIEQCLEHVGARVNISQKYWRQQIHTHAHLFTLIYAYLSICLSIYHSFIHSFISFHFISFHSFIHLCLYLSMSIYVYLYLSISIYIYVSIYYMHVTVLTFNMHFSLVTCGLNCRNNLENLIWADCGPKPPPNMQQQQQKLNLRIHL